MGAVANAVFVRYFLLGQEMWSDALPIARTDRHFYPEEQALGSTRSCSSVGSRWLDGGAIGIFPEGVSHLNLQDGLESHHERYLEEGVELLPADGNRADRQGRGF